MSDDETSTIDVKGLDSLLRALKAKMPTSRIGILSDKTHYSQLKTGQKQPHSAPTNAEIGAAHEYGAPARGLPQRSFLRTPISDNLSKYMERSGALDKEVLAEVLKEGSILPWMKKVTVLAETIVLEAFATQGFGKWAAWKTKGYTNNTGDILVDTTQLRNSITSEVKA